MHSYSTLILFTDGKSCFAFNLPTLSFCTLGPFPAAAGEGELEPPSEDLIKMESNL